MGNLKRCTKEDKIETKHLLYLYQPLVMLLVNIYMLSVVMGQ